MTLFRFQRFIFISDAWGTFCLLIFTRMSSFSTLVHCDRSIFVMNSNILCFLSNDIMHISVCQLHSQINDNADSMYSYVKCLTHPHAHKDTQILSSTTRAIWSKIDLFQTHSHTHMDAHIRVPLIRPSMIRRLTHDATTNLNAHFQFTRRVQFPTSSPIDFAAAHLALWMRIKFIQKTTARHLFRGTTIAFKDRFVSELKPCVAIG